MGANRTPEPLSGALERWLTGEGPRTVGGLIEVFEEKSFAVLFTVLLSVSALPLPTGGATHVLQVVAALLALQLIAGREHIWLPRRWREMDLAGERGRRVVEAQLRLIRRLERISRPRMRFLFGGRLSGLVFGLVVLAGTAGAFFAPPFTGLDTLPSLGVVLISIAVLLEDVVIAVIGLAVLTAGIGLEIFLGKAAVDAIRDLV